MAARWALAVVLLIGLLIMPVPGAAQTDGITCPLLAERAFTALGELCRDLDANSACYGFQQVEAVFTGVVEAGFFTRPGERASLSLISTLHAAPPDLASAQWGVALVSAQAVIAETSPAPAMTLLLLGDVTLERRTPAGDVALPLQSFYFRAGFGASSCGETPSLLVVQSPANTPVDLTINGAPLRLTGLVTWQWQSANSLTATVQQGQLEIAEGPTAQAGQTLVAVIDQEGTVLFWSAPRAANEGERQAGQVVAQAQGALGDTAASVVPVEEAETCGTHVVRSGDNLFRIAIRYNTTVEAIARANNIANPNLLRLGQELTIPCAGTTGTGAGPGAMPLPTSSGSASAACGPDVIHTVARGENLFRIAILYGTTMDAIARANGITNPQLISVGQRLVIPCAQ